MHPSFKTAHECARQLYKTQNKFMFKKYVTHVLMNQQNLCIPMKRDFTQLMCDEYVLKQIKTDF